MKAKAQIFAVDVIISIILVILAIGIISAAAEFNFYNSKQQTSYAILKQKAETAAIVLANSNWSSCSTGNTNLSYSINTIKINAINPNPDTRKAEIKKRLGLEGYKANIILQTPVAYEILNEEMTDPNAVSLELNVFVCTGGNVAQNLLNSCMEGGACTFSERKLIITVGK